MLKTKSNIIYVGIGEVVSTRTPGQSLKTMALGSCVAVVILDPTTHSVGMVHVALPDSKVDEVRAKEKPGYFADTAINELIQKMKREGADPTGRHFFVKLVGGANVMDPQSTFNIGKRNLLAIKKSLWKFGLGTFAEDTGGSISRNVEVDVDTGSVHISSPGREKKEI